jgi:hypothetical protein
LGGTNEGYYKPTTAAGYSAELVKTVTLSDFNPRPSAELDLVGNPGTGIIIQIPINIPQPAPTPAILVGMALLQQESPQELIN